MEKKNFTSVIADVLDVFSNSLRGKSEADISTYSEEEQTLIRSIMTSLKTDELKESFLTTFDLSSVENYSCNYATSFTNVKCEKKDVSLSLLFKSGKSIIIVGRHDGEEKYSISMNILKAASSGEVVDGISEACQVQ